ncbi:Small-conductance mechanosensitive channel [Marinobacter daqiaonensis]|uniref:Small-conductance mechanosensitive channel n=1 Tax=Marinobacter daqiaonensis TaxID=650891 RepID=A0A1I6I7H5_9GAMM|nr:mechanosensitive ion channel family protein [Marinobacter daqiaonensis]SFR62614.1 Small-conductance mechanosensitive channel [Marinobacter daqiaonensis]
MKDLLVVCLTALTLAMTMPVAHAQMTESTEPEIRVQDTPRDQAIQSRLKAVLAAIDGLEDVEATVQAGVVTLEGQVSSARSARELTAVAQRVEGVVFVQNRLQEEVDVAARLQPARRKFQELVATVIRTLPLTLAALGVVVVFALLGRWISHHADWLRHLGFSELASHLGKRVIRLIITGIGILLALEILDATALVGAMLGVAGVAGIAVGFAFRNIVENYLAGVLLSARNPFNIGDNVQMGELAGSVVRLTSRDTVLMTAEGNHLRIPNSMIMTSPLTNFTRNPLRQFDFPVNIAANLDPADARRLGTATLRGMKGVLSDPGPLGVVNSLGEGTVQLRFFGWIDQRETDFLKARSEAIRLIKAAFDGAGIEMPAPTYRIRTDDSPSRAGQKPETTVAPHEPVDVAADYTIDRQVEDELRTSGEENLLKAGRNGQQ